MGSTRYIMSIGELTRKDNSLCFRKNGRNVYIPVENTKEIYCFNEVGIKLMYVSDPPFGYKNFLYYAFLRQNTICRHKIIINHYI